VLLSVVAGILNANEGTVTIFGQEVSSMSDRARTRFRARHIGFVFQQYNLLPALTAAENAAIPLVIAGFSKGKAVDRAKLVYRLLSEEGIPARRMSYKGMGNTEMIYPHARTEEEMRKNMRVEIFVIQTSSSQPLLQ